jgi:hypothetical protein
MCDYDNQPSEDDVGGVTRRRVLGYGIAASAVLMLPGLGTSGARAAATGAGMPVIHRRREWAGDGFAPTGPLQAEDVRFLLVHHTAGPTQYARDAVPGMIQGIYRFHTGPEKGWPDICYNFFVDRFGEIWEARAGSLDGPVMCDATGGSQGFAQLVCLMGNYHENAPAPEMIESCCWLLAHLADRYGVDTRAGTTTEIVSRGSNKWPAGTAVTARTIAGHREMSATLCPGDFVQPLLDRDIPERVGRYRSASAAAVAATTTVPPETVPPETAPPETVPVETVPAETVAPQTVPAETVAPETVASTVTPESLDEFIEAAPVPVAPEIPSGTVPEMVGPDAGGSSSTFRTVAGVVSVSAAGVAAGAALVQRQQQRRRVSEISTDELLDEER